MNCENARHLIVETLTGTVPPDLRRAVEEHLASCRDCRAEAAMVEETIGLLRAVPEARLREEHWADFMARLERRLETGRSIWEHLRRWWQNPRHAWQTVAATSVLIIALGAAWMMQPGLQVVEVPSPTNAQLHVFVTDAVRQGMPGISSSLTVWKAGLGASEVTYELTGGR